MRPLYIFVLLCGLGPLMASAQIASSSFAVDSVSVNPAAAATREQGIVGIFVNYAKTKTKINPGLAISYDQELEVQKNEIIFAGRDWMIVPEGYVSFGKGEKVIVPSYQDSASSNKNEITNYQVNLALNHYKRVKFGLQYVKPQKELDVEISVNDPAESFSIIDSFSGSVEGIGAGVTGGLTKALNLGFYYLHLHEKGKIDQVYRKGAEPPIEGYFLRDISYAKKGVGLSYLKGSARSSAARFEFSYSLMDPIYEEKEGQPKPKGGEQAAVAAEFIWKKFVAGLNAQYTKGSFINFREYLDFIMDEGNVSQDDYVMTYGGFFSLKSKGGHSVGVTGSFSKRRDKVSFIGEERDADINSYSFGANYAYLF